MTLLDRLKKLLGSSQAPPSHSDECDQSSAACKPISCMEAMARVQEYLDGELEGVSHEEVAQHFSICQKCYPHLRLEERFRELLHRSQEGEVCPERLKEQVLELLAAEAGELQ
jgi:anti-sigma factor (TIGR02949 family)